MTIPAPNFALIDKVMDKISTDQAHWTQNSWRRQVNDQVPQGPYRSHGKSVLPVDCGTAFCFAGWAVQLGSETAPRWATNETLWPSKYDDRTDINEDGEVAAMDRAKRLLGLSTYRADLLFSGSNSLSALTALVADIRSGKLTTDLDALCPRCGSKIYGRAATSRVDNLTQICPQCGTAEAMFVAANESSLDLPPVDQAVFA